MLWKCKMLAKTVVIKFFGKFPKLISNENYSRLLFFIVFGRRIDLEHPHTFNEHIVAKKLEDKKFSYAKYTDKYAVHEYVCEAVGEQYLNQVYSVYDSFDDIDFNLLPNQFALKATHASGYNIIVRDKTKLDIDAARRKFAKWMKTNFYYKDREKNYYNIRPRILCDKYIEFGDVLVEYKLYCFNGKVKLICQNVEKGDRRYTNVLNEDYQPIPVKFGYESFPYPITDNKEELTRVAEELSKPFDFVRVDLYENQGRIIFSELTFHSGGGLVPFVPASYDLEFCKFFEKSDSKETR